MKLPVVEQEGGINPTRGAMLDLNTAGQMGQVVGNIGQQIGVYAEAWQKVQNASEQLAGKNDLEEQADQIIKEATDYSGWSSSKDIQTKQADLNDRMGKLLGNITNGFANDRNKADFQQKYQHQIQQYQNQLDGIFRSKYIDNTNATLLRSAQRNKDAFISSGDEAFRQSYMDDIGTAYSAGFITETNYAKLSAAAKGWDFGYAESEALQRPEETLADLKRFGLDAKDTQRVKDIAESILKKRKDAIKNGKTEEEAMEISMTQQINKQMFEDQWKADKGKIQKDMNSIFEFRNAIQEKFMANDLSQKDYAKLQADTIAPLLEKVKNHSAGNPVWWNTSFDEAVLGVEKKVGLENANDEVKAYVYDLVYSSLKERNIDPDKRFGRDDKAIGEIVENVSAEYLRNKEPNLLGVEANKVLLGTKMFDYKLNGGGKEVKPQKYQLMQDKNGVRYKVYADKDGKYTDSSIMERVQ